MRSDPHRKRTYRWYVELPLNDQEGREMLSRYIPKGTAPRRMRIEDGTRHPLYSVPWEAVRSIRAQADVRPLAFFVQEARGKIRPAPKFSCSPNRRYLLKLRNYARGRQDADEYHLWSSKEERMILARNRPSDRELAVLIGASVEAIQVRRSKLRSARRDARRRRGRSSLV